MVTLQALALTLSITGGGQTVLLDFYGDYCPPCQQMMPVVDQLQAAGYPVRKIDVGKQQQLARQFGVNSVPCFILVSGGQIVDRVNNATSRERLLQMFAKAGYRPGARGGSAVAVAPSGSFQAPKTESRIWPPESSVPPADRPAPRTSVRGSTKNTATIHPIRPAAPTELAMAASVRLKVNDGGGFSYGSGTIIDTQDGEALVLTCGHIFRSSSGQGTIDVDLFDRRGGHVGSVKGQLIHFDNDRDVGLVSIRTKLNVQPMRVAGPGYRVDRGARVFSIGCDRGAAPSIRESRVTHINKYLGPANIEVAGAPIDGRSGGGLFTADGTLIGVCNAADPQDDEGLYAALETVHTVLTAANLSFVYTRGETRIADAQPRSAPSNPVPEKGRMSDARTRASGGNTGGQANLSIPHLADEDTEVILIVRSRSKPHQEGEVMFIQRPTRGLLDAISAQRLQKGPQPTSLQVPAPLRPTVRGQN